MSSKSKKNAKGKANKKDTTRTSPDVPLEAEPEVIPETKAKESKKEDVNKKSSFNLRGFLRVSESAREFKKNHPNIWMLVRFCGLIIASFLIIASCKISYNIRLTPVRIYGKIIHEFDPWFNFRAAEYMAANGLRRFFHWFDYRAWYPIGRPVGTTMFPGMQFLAVGLWRLGKWAAATFGRKELAISLNDICVMIPAWCSTVSVTCIALITYMASHSWLSAAASALCMAMVPAHLMRTMAGVYDNESVAVPAMCLSFMTWLATLRSKRSWPFGIVAGLAYGYMAATWGGYIYAGNTIACHAAVLILLGHRTPELTYGYTLWWVISTTMAYLIPTIGKLIYLSLENAAPIVVLVGLWVLYACDKYSERKKHTPSQAFWTKVKAVCACIVALIAVLMSGLIIPFSIRVRSLFLKHTRTGNPLVDSVAEHTPGSWDRFVSLLGELFQMTFVGVGVTILSLFVHKKENNHFGAVTAKWFILVYTSITMYFTTRMSRLLLLMGPVSSVMSGIAIGRCAADPIVSLIQWVGSFFDKGASEEVPPVAEEKSKKGNKEKNNKPKKSFDPVEFFDSLRNFVIKMWNNRVVLVARMLVFSLLFSQIIQKYEPYKKNTETQAIRMSSPHIMIMTQTHSGQPYLIRDYYDGYLWMRHNTPKDSRILAWWDYGYQISGIARRISLADGNTWNLEHIATVGRMLALPEKKGYELARLVADYVMVWAGSFGDDIGKSPHIARISNSVYHDICPNDPYCTSFSIGPRGKPTKSMAASMLYKMCYHNVRSGVKVDPELFEEVYTSKNGLMRVFKILNISEESKAWCADPKNRVCDHPGSWYCPGQYPPGFPPPPKFHTDLPP